MSIYILAAQILILKSPSHGIDSLNCTLASLLETSAMGLGPTRLGAFTALVPCIPMFFSTWETYHTHTLYLGYINGPTEGLILAATIMLMSAYYTPSVWTSPLSSLFGFESYLGSTSVVDIWGPILIVSLVLAHIPDCVMNVIRARRAKNLPIAPVFLEWTPMAVFTLSLCFWLGSSNSHILSDNHLTLLCLTLSFVFGRMTTKIILAHLTHQPFPYWTVMLAPLIGGAVLVNLPILGLPAPSADFELWYLSGYFIFALVAYSRWAILVINAICDFLQINCLTIPEEKWKVAKEMSLPKLERTRSAGRVALAKPSVRED